MVKLPCQWLRLLPVKPPGGAFIVMGSKYIGADVNLARPSAEIAVMGAQRGRKYSLP